MQLRAGGISGKGAAHLDLLNLPFESRSVDAVYCCHVLNSLQDDIAAMREVHRVVRDDGIAILQVPAFHTGAETVETKGRDDRVARFGDEGIYRCYTPDDYVARLESVGFAVSPFRARDLPSRDVERSALADEVLHCCRRAP